MRHAAASDDRDKQDEYSDYDELHNRDEQSPVRLGDTEDESLILQRIRVDEKGDGSHFHLFYR